MEKTADEIKDYLQNGGGDLKKYNEWCENLIEEYHKNVGVKITYGHAQKIINMAFKYLYCIYYKAEKLDENKFTQCHMPLDSFSLEWFYRYYQKNDCRREIKACNEEINININGELFCKNGKIKKDSISSWSAMKSIDDYGTKYPYEFYWYNIKMYCDEKINPLALDFIVWEKMQKIMVAEEFIKTFGETPKEDVSYAWEKLDETLKVRLEQVKNIGEERIAK